MHGIEVLYWALSVLFCLFLVFAILLWCRSWRKEEREATDRRLQILSREIGRLSEAIELLDHTAASFQTADEQLSKQVEDIQKALRLTARPPVLPEIPRDSKSPPPDPSSEPLPEVEDRYREARALLQEGQSPLEVARKLDLGTAEVRMIARVLKGEKTDPLPPGQNKNGD